MAPYWTKTPRISTEYTYKGIDATIMENAYLRVMVLQGKGGDILELRDKQTDVDVLWHANHNWQPPKHRYVPAETRATWLDHYPGGWQVNLPIAGNGRDIQGNAYGMHGESALIPWDATVSRDDTEAVSLRLTTELVRYPFFIERELTLPADNSEIEIVESITNRGGIELEYIWQHHIALGAPLLGPEAYFELPAERGEIHPYEEGTFETGRLAGGESFDWPYAPDRDGGTIDLREFPPPDEEIHDQAYATKLDEGWYRVSNTALNLGFEVEFPLDPFECVWYWQAFGGLDSSPFYNRNYNAGIEPTTAYPNNSIPEAQRQNGTMKTLTPGETITSELTATTYHDVNGSDT